LQIVILPETLNKPHTIKVCISEVILKIPVEGGDFIEAEMESAVNRFKGKLRCSLIKENATSSDALSIVRYIWILINKFGRERFISCGPDRFSSLLLITHFEAFLVHPGKANIIYAYLIRN
jgi:hypothetical protein